MFPARSCENSLQYRRAELITRLPTPRTGASSTIPLRSDPGTWDIPLSWFEFAAFEVVTLAGGSHATDPVNLSPCGNGDDFTTFHHGIVLLIWPLRQFNLMSAGVQVKFTLQLSFALIIISGCKIARDLASNDATTRLLVVKHNLTSLRSDSPKANRSYKPSNRSHRGQLCCPNRACLP